MQQVGLLVILVSSDPGTKTVTPFGGTTPIYTPNPIPAGIPTRGDLILIDTSVSCTTNGLALRLQAEETRLPSPWLLDSDGEVTDDPNALFTEPPGSILPLGGVELGYKGFSLGILVETLTSALGGYGRAEQPTHCGASLFLQVLDQDAFGGTDACAAHRRAAERAILQSAERTATTLATRDQSRTPRVHNGWERGET